MKKIIFTIILISSVFYFQTIAAEFEKDVFNTSDGELEITFIGHGTLMMEFAGKVIHIDPVGRYADYSALPKADLILITHEHGDHLDLEIIELLLKSTAEVVLTKICHERYNKGIVMANGESGVFQGLSIDAIAAYNIKNMRSENNPFHPKGNGNGYVIKFGDKNVYIAGDTENTPEMAQLKNIDIAFLPMNLPYTMTPEMVADAARSFNPKVLYPYHFGNTDTGKLVELLKSDEGIEVRIRKLQ